MSLYHEKCLESFGFTDQALNVSYLLIRKGMDILDFKLFLLQFWVPLNQDFLPMSFVYSQLLFSRILTILASVSTIQ